MNYMNNPTFVFTFIVSILAIIFFLNEQKNLKLIFKYFPPVIWAYFIPMFFTNINILPSSSALYDWSKSYLLPASLLLLLSSCNIKLIKKLGFKAILTMLIGTLGIILGATFSFMIFKNYLPINSWKGVAALSGSWIGGSQNMIAVGKSIGTPDELFGNMIVIDTIVGYGWMGIVIFLSGYQNKLDKWNNADKSVLKLIEKKIINDELTKSTKSTDFKHIVFIIALSFFCTIISIIIGNALPEGNIINNFGWSIILITAIGISLSFTNISKLNQVGSAHIGNFFLYILIATIGAQANITSLASLPYFVLLGVVWIIIHAGVLFLGGRLLKVPMFLIATSSQANIGGVVSAPIVASVYNKSLAPVGLLMGILGNIIGIYFALFTAGILKYVDSVF